LSGAGELMPLKRRRKRNNWLPQAACLQDAEEQLRTFPARSILSYEVTEHLSTALDFSKSLLIISSRNLGRAIVDARFLRRVETALQRNVRVIISITDATGSDKPAIELERLRNRYPGLELYSKRRSAFHHLVCDDQFALICNRPLLGNLGKVCTFQHVVGFLLQATHLVSAFATRIEPRST
jgi:hypothetical protein